MDFTTSRLCEMSMSGEAIFSMSNASSSARKCLKRTATLGAARKFIQLSHVALDL